jgi:hypothetical protein
VSWDVILKSMVTTTDSQGEVLSLELNVDSLVAEEIEIVLDVNDWDCDIESSNFLLDFSLNTFVLLMIELLLVCAPGS